MKKQTSKAIVTVTCIILANITCLNSCKHKQVGKEPGKVDTSKKMFTSNGTMNLLFNRPICRDLADSCIAAYQQLYHKPITLAQADSIVKSYSENVTFNADSLTNWLDDIKANTNVKSIEVCFGIYTQKMIDTFPDSLKGKLRRLSVFFKAVNKDKEFAIYKKGYHPPYLNNRAAMGCRYVKKYVSDQDTTDYFNLGSVYP